MTDQARILFICTVGGTPAPIVVALCHWRPDRVLFVSSEETKPKVNEILQAYAASAGSPLSPGSYRICPTADSDSLPAVLNAVRSLEPEVREWLEHGPTYKIVADFTGGTKCMSAALVLQARRWKCSFSYVGGVRRTKDGVGVVEPGFERLVHSANPWDALGYQAIEDACLLFDRHAFAAAVHVLDTAIRSVDDPAVRRTLSTFRQLCEGYDHWDRFQHEKAATILDNVLKNANDLARILGSFNDGDRLARRIRRHRQLLEEIGAACTSLVIVRDLLANARRRADERRYDDAVARLYRAIEALAQCRLRESYGIDSSAVPIEKLPESLCRRWQSRADQGLLKLGLQDDYELLRELNDDLGIRFYEKGLNDPIKSPLAARNQSILAHGYRPVSEKTFDTLWKIALQLASIDEDALPCFPQLVRKEG